MMKEVVRAMDTGLLALVGLVAFLVAFTLILVRVAVMKKSEREAAKNLPLHDEEEFRPSSNHDD